MTDKAAQQACDEAQAAALRQFCHWPFVIVQPKRLGVAVSGGSDSMALLDLMDWQAKQSGFDVFAVSVDHGLRPEAKDECAFVAAFCKSRGIPHTVLTWDGWDGRGNLQARARKARYGLIRDWAERKGVDWIALGHTLEDQAETVLMRLARSSGVDGLAGMPDHMDRDGLRFIRPILSQSRDDLRDYLRHRKIDWCEDPSNEDDSFERVRARRASKVLADLGVDVHALNRVAWHAQSAKWALNHYLFSEVRENGLVKEDRGDLILPERTPTPEFEVPLEIHRRAMNASLQWVNGADYPPRSMSLIHMSAAMMDADQHTLGGCVLTRVKGAKHYMNKLRITREYNAVRSLACPTDQLWDGRWKLDGPHRKSFEIRALGEAVNETLWRDTGMPRVSLLASPAIWRGEELIAAPLAGLENGWTAEATGRGKFTDFLISR